MRMRKGVGLPGRDYIAVRVKREPRRGRTRRELEARRAAAAYQEERCAGEEGGGGRLGDGDGADAVVGAQDVGDAVVAELGCAGEVGVGVGGWIVDGVDRKSTRL